MRVVVSGGGTGGHIFPALAVAQSLRRLDPDVELLYIGGVSGMETEIVPGHGVPFQAVTARKLRKLLSPGTIGVLLSLVKGYGEARTLLRNFGAQAVVGTGGYVAGATVLASARLHIPTVILESNAVPGRTNRFLARFARKVCVTFPETAAQFAPDKAVMTGLPLRANIVAPAEVTPATARCRLTGLAADRFTVLVVGGSQGALAVNKLVLETASRLLEAGIQVLHQAGARHFESVCDEAQQRGLVREGAYRPIAFLNEEQMPLALRAADVIVCRGGMSTLSEVMANGLPAIVVPLPTAYADHQTANARAMETQGAALLRAQAELTPEVLARDLLALRDDPDGRLRMSEASRALGRPQAADDVARLVLEQGARRP